ncbi:transcriptional regulator NrdR [Candidatus Gracilibacteria bacterium]|nr:MAG: transcriptional regulator NrdR [Candidatus Gracilibacteria bacterium]PIE85323.1 MAG: transcriptional regulator NrdR [Candidatus Gracilibacteria bacterium]
MYCFNCGNSETKVIDSRTSEDGKSIRRRRECNNCHNRFTTFEKLEIMDLVVEKSGNKRERYNRKKLEDSILLAVNKRNLNIIKINNIIKQLEFKWNTKEEITSKEIGADVLEILLELDEVSYIRYASVHLQFKSAKDFIDFIREKKIRT